MGISLEEANDVFASTPAMSDDQKQRANFMRDKFAELLHLVDANVVREPRSAADRLVQIVKTDLEKIQPLVTKAISRE